MWDIEIIFYDRILMDIVIDIVGILFLADYISEF